MRIALVQDVAYPYVTGGAEKRFYEIGQRLGKKHDVHLFCMKYWRGPDVIKQENMTLHGVCKARAIYTTSSRRRILQPIIYSLALYRPLARERFDIIDCSNFPYFSLFTARLAKHNAKLVATWHEVWGLSYWREYLGIFGWLGYVVEKLASKMPSKISAASALTERKLRRELGVRAPIVRIPNGVDYAAIAKIKPSTLKSDIIYAGRLAPYKHIDILLRAVALIPKKTLVIVGDGPEKEKLISLCEELGIKSRVTFLPFQKKPEDVYALMKASKVFVLPSTREGFGIVVLEAHACGLPVITTNHPENAAREMINEERSDSVVSLDAKRLAISIQSNMRTVRQEQISEQFTWDSVSTKTFEAYQ